MVYIPDKVYCEYLAESEDVVREHARLGAFPADSIAKVSHICDPTTATDDFADLRTSKSNVSGISHRLSSLI